MSQLISPPNVQAPMPAPLAPTLDDVAAKAVTPPRSGRASTFMQSPQTRQPTPDTKKELGGSTRGL